MPRTVLKVTPVSAPLPPHEQSILNSLVYTALCTEEIFSILNKVSEPQRHDALYNAISWCLTHDLVADEEQGQVVPGQGGSVYGSVPTGL